MTKKINIELDSEYIEHLELLKQIIPSAEGEQITDNSKMLEVLIDTFMSFVQEQASQHNNAEQSSGGCASGGNGSCGCSH